MEQNIKVFTGQAIEVKMIKNHLKKNGIESFADRHDVEGDSEWTERGFDPYIDLKVDEKDVEKSVKLIEDFLNERAD